MSWFEEWFDEEYVQVYGHRDSAEARRDVAFAEKVLGLKPCQLILDLCCGAGRHLVALCEKGYTRLVGVDLSLPLLRLAQAAISGRCCLGQVLLADMRHLPLAAEFDVVLNLFTSFGYFESDAENLQVLQSVHRVLRPEGQFVFDYLNPESVVRSLRERTDRRVGERRVVETRMLDLARKRVNKRITIYAPTGVKHYEESVRLYSREEMMQLFQAAQLGVSAVYGDFDCRPADAEAPRMIFVGRRRAF